MRAGQVWGVLYMWGVILGGGWVLGRWFSGLNFDHAAELGVLVLVFMAAEWLTVSLPHGRLTCGFAVTLAAFLLFGPAAAAWTAAAGTLFGQGIVNRGAPLRITLFNAAQLAVSAYAAYHAYLLVGGPADQPLVAANVPPILVFCITYFTVNHLLVALYIGPNRERFPRIGRRAGLEWDASVYLMMIPLGVLTVLLYRAVGLTGAVLVLLPILVVQWVLARFVRLKLQNLELEALYKVAKRLGAGPDLEKLLDLILEETRRILPYHTAVVYLWSPERRQYTAVAVSGKFAADLQDSALGDEEGIVAWAVELKEPSIVYDTRTEPRFTEAQGLPQFLRSLLIIPLVVDNVVRGILVVGERRPYAYDERNLHILAIIARQAAVAMYNFTLSRRAGRLADTDALTGLGSRTAFWKVLADEWERAREGRPLSVILLGLRHFRTVNREFGYRSGDGILVQAAALLRSRVRDKGYLARYGGVVFAVLLPDTGKIQALETAECLRRAVEHTPLRIEGSRFRANLTAHVGVGTYPADADRVDELLVFAEQALHDASRERDRRAAEAGANPLV